MKVRYQKLLGGRYNVWPAENDTAGVPLGTLEKTYSGWWAETPDKSDNYHADSRRACAEWLVRKAEH